MNSIHSIDNYLDTVCSCIKHREVHEDIKQELRAHLEDIVAEEISSGKSPDEALKAAVYSMGDPISVGSSLNSVHKPRFEWTIGAILCGFLIIALITMQSLKGFVLFENLVRDTIAFSAIGIVLGLVMYLIDYRKLNKLWEHRDALSDHYFSFENPLRIGLLLKVFAVSLLVTLVIRYTVHKFRNPRLEG